MKNTPPEKRTLGKMSLKNTTSGAGEQFLLLACKAKARVKGVFVHRHRYVTLWFGWVLHDLVWSGMVWYAAVLGAAPCYTVM